MYNLMVIVILVILFEDMCLNSRMMPQHWVAAHEQGATLEWFMGHMHLVVQGENGSADGRHC